MRRTFAILFAVLVLTPPAHSQSTPPPASVPKFIEIDGNALLLSALIGLNVRNGAGETTGEIADVAFEGGQLVGVVLSVGGTSKENQDYVAVDPSSISIKFTESENKWTAHLNASVDQLKSAQKFRYEGKWKRRPL